LDTYARVLSLAALVAAVATGCTSAPPPQRQPPPPQRQSPPPDAGPTAVSIVDARLRRAWPDDPHGPAWFTASGYQVFARHPGDFVAVRAPTVSAVDDVVVSGSFRKVGGPPGGGYGIIVRDRRAGAGDGLDQSGQFMVAGVGDRGDVGIWRRDGNEWFDLIPWKASTSVHRGSAANDLRVQVVGDQLRFDVNGTHVASIVAPLLTGRVGIFVGGDLNQVLVDRLVVQPLASAPQADLRGKEQDIATVSTQIAALSARARQSSQKPSGEDLRWRDEVAGVSAVVQQIARDLDTDYGASEPRRVQRVASLLGELEQAVVGVLEGFQDGFDSPRSPVNNPAALATAANRLDDAARTAEQIRAEVEALRLDYGATAK
jgi:hypothetical protein